MNKSFWDVTTGEEIVRFAPEDPFPSSGQFAPDRSAIALSDTSGGVRLVHIALPEGNLREAVCASLPVGRRAFSRDEIVEFGFLEAAESEPCNRPSLLSVAQMGLFLRDFTARTLRTFGLGR